MVTRHLAFPLAFLTAGAILIAAVGMRMALASPDGSEVEPNNTCATAQNLGAVSLPVLHPRSLDTPPAVPDVDYFRLTGPAGARWQADLEGALTGQGTLPDPPTRPVRFRPAT